MKQKDHLDSDDFMQKMKRTVALREDCGIFFEQELPRPAGELFYAIEDQKLVRKDEKPACGYIQIVSKTEFAQQYGMLDESGLLLYHYEENSIDNIDVFEDHVVGTFVVPMKGSVLESKVSVGFYVTESRILLLDETSMLYNVLERMTKRQKIRDLDISHVFVRILDCMISDDMLLLQKYSMVLDQMEDYLEENVSDLPHNFTSFIMQNKKELRALMVYYRSLNYMVDELAESDIFDGIVERRLQSFDNKATKLYAETASLHEAAQQLRDVYQAKIDIRQNKVMSILTIVTTIFMPLTLIVGWYGMNVKMPEVGWPYSYPIIILASIAVTIIEILIFKKKKWFCCISGIDLQLPGFCRNAFAFIGMKMRIEYISTEQQQEYCSYSKLLFFLYF